METITKQPEVKNFIGGAFTRNGQPSMDIESPLTGEVISTLPMSSAKDLDAAVKAAADAYPSWSAMTLKERVQIFFRYRDLLEKNMDELTKLVQLENGKLYGEANDNYLSFPMEGYSLALDFKIEDGLFDFLEKLDGIVNKYNGRIYLTKDVCVSKENLEKGYPQIDTFRQYRKDNKMDETFQSLQSKRVGI